MRGSFDPQRGHISQAENHWPRAQPLNLSPWPTSRSTAWRLAHWGMLGVWAFYSHTRGKGAQKACRLKGTHLLSPVQLRNQFHGFFFLVGLKTLNSHAIPQIPSVWHTNLSIREDDCLIFQISVFITKKNENCVTCRSGAQRLVFPHLTHFGWAVKR